ncbi:hypothetical protein, partial [Ralstonia pseudosolanacearum]|uniref:hypothetical protein n=1 Tax=Ralstonia pseudosolanacearum TaxID=1310165 RepID=UPI001E58DF30
FLQDRYDLALAEFALPHRVLVLPLEAAFSRFRCLLSGGAYECSGCVRNVFSRIEGSLPWQDRVVLGKSIGIVVTQWIAVYICINVNASREPYESSCLWNNNMANDLAIV